MNPSFDNAAACVWADEHGITYLTWKAGPRTLAEFQAAMEALLQLVVRSGTGKALVNQRAMVPLTPQEQAWVVTHWMPRARGQGRYRYAAVLPPRDAVARLAAAAVRNQLAVDEPRYELFDDESAALAWLRRQVVIHSSF